MALTIEETTDHYLQTVYRIKDGWKRVAEVYSMKDAEVVKEALEKAREEEEKNDYSW